MEWTVDTLLESDMAHAFTEGSNADMTATDTQKNTVCTRPEIACATSACYVAECRRAAASRHAGVLHSKTVQSALQPRGVRNSLGAALCAHLSQGAPPENWRSAVSHQRAVGNCYSAPGLQVSKAKVWVEQAPWQRACLGGQLHKHGTGLPPVCYPAGVCWRLSAGTHALLISAHVLCCARLHSSGDRGADVRGQRHRRGADHGGSR